MALAVTLNGVAFALNTVPGWIPGMRVIVNATLTLSDPFIAALDALEGATYSASVALTSVEYRLDDGTLLGTSSSPGSVTVTVNSLQRSAAGRGRLVFASIPHYPATAYTGTAYCTAFTVVGDTEVTESAPTPPVSPDVGGLYTRFYNNQDLVGVPSYVDSNEYPQIVYTSGAPRFGVTNQYSARWTGFIRVPSTGKWQFRLSSDDGCRLFINGQTLVDDWDGGAAIRDTVRVDLDAGVDHDIWIEMRNRVGGGGFDISYRLAPEGTQNAFVLIPGAQLYATLPAPPTQSIVTNGLHYVESINRY